MRDREIMENPDRWPLWPLLPLTRERTDGREYGVLVDTLRRYLVLHVNLFHPGAKRQPIGQQTTYPSVTAILDDGWEIKY